jgi:hypothetical protein
VSNVSQFQHQHQETLHTDTDTPVRRRSPFESAHVVLHVLGVHLQIFHALREHGRIVDTLATGDNLLSAKEDVK